MLLEREADIDALAAVMARARDGDGAIAIVEGPPGIGKSALLAVARARAAEDGLVVLDARGGELERAFPYGVARQLLERPAREDGAELLNGAAALAGPALGLTEHPSASSDSELTSAHGLYWLASNLADRGPLAILVDDAQWADEPSLAFLLYLARRLEGTPIAVLAAVRAGHRDELVEQLVAAPGGQVLRPKILSEAASATLVAAEYSGAEPAASFVAACHAVSGGNPFLLEELVKALREDGIAPDDRGAERAAGLSPATVGRSVLMRLRGASPTASSLSRAVAILGEDVELRHAAALADTTPEEASQAADELAELHVLSAGRPLNVVHPLIGQAIRGDLAAGERAAFHGRAARILVEDGAPPSAAAPHLLAAEPRGDAWVARTLYEAADSARMQGAVETTPRLLRRALDEGATENRSGLLRELGEAEWHTGHDYLEAIEHMREAHTLAEDDDSRAATAVILGRYVAWAGDPSGAVDLLGAARSECTGASAEAQMALEAEEAQWLLLTPVGAGRSWDELERHASLPGDTVAEQLLLADLAQLRWSTGTASEAGEFARRALAEDRLFLGGRDHFTEFGQACWVLGLADDHESTRKALEGVDREELPMSPVLTAAGGQLLAALAWAAGDLHECEFRARTALDSGVLPLAIVPLSESMLACVLAERGELEEADAAIERSFIWPELPVSVLYNLVYYFRGYVRRAQGRLEEAVADFAEHGRRDAACGAANPVYDWRLGAAECLAALGDSEQARTLTSEHMEIARRWGTHSAIGTALRGRALVADGDERIELLGTAVEELERSPARLAHARAEVDLGTALRVTGRKPEAIESLRGGLERARTCGATTLVERAHAELVTAGARPRRLQFSGVESLTASERRAASLASEGMTNTQIAQALFVTRSTVEKHLTNAYRKLDIGSREQLPDALSTPDPAG